MIEIRKLNKSFDNKRVIQDIDLTVPDGESLAVFGPNGAGKSTLIGMLSGLIRPTSGEIRIEGADLRDDPRIRGKVGLVSHQPLLYTELTARENLVFYGRLFDVPDLSRSIPDILKLVGLELRTDDLVRTYSRGMVQRLAIARALLHNPTILLLDEPFTGLDQQAGRFLERVVQDRAAKGSTVIMATHNLRQGFGLCRQFLMLRRGQVVYHADRNDLDEERLATIYDQYTNGEKR